MAKKKEKKFSLKDIIKIECKSERSLNKQDIITKYIVDEITFTFWENKNLYHGEKKIIQQALDGCFIKKIGSVWYHPTLCIKCGKEEKIKHTIYECEKITNEKLDLQIAIKNILSINVNLKWEDDKDFNKQVNISTRGSISTKLKKELEKK